MYYTGNACKAPVQEVGQLEVAGGTADEQRGERRLIELGVGVGVGLAPLGSWPRTCRAGAAPA